MLGTGRNSCPFCDFFCCELDVRSINGMHVFGSFFIEKHHQQPPIKYIPIIKRPGILPGQQKKKSPFPSKSRIHPSPSPLPPAALRVISDTRDVDLVAGQRASRKESQLFLCMCQTCLNALLAFSLFFPLLFPSFYRYLLLCCLQGRIKTCVCVFVCPRQLASFRCHVPDLAEKHPPLAGENPRDQS